VKKEEVTTVEAAVKLPDAVLSTTEKVEEPLTLQSMGQFIFQKLTNRR